MRLALGWTVGVRCQAAVSDFSHHTVQTGSGACPAFYPIRTISQGLKRPGCEADNSSPSTAEVKNGEAIPPVPHMFSLHGVVLIY
jgi:hypothetical protein